MRVIVCGGRSYSDRDTLFKALDWIHLKEPITTIVHGGCSGADNLAAQWAKEIGVRLEEHKANWKLYGPAAGPIRNREMAETFPNLVLAFPGGRGTEDMIRVAQNKGIETRRIEA